MRLLQNAILFFLLAPMAFPLQVFASNASIGEAVYVLAAEENGSLFEGNGTVVSPSGSMSAIEIKNGQAAFGADEVGGWEVHVGGVKRAAIVFDEGARVRWIARDDGFFAGFSLAIGIVFVLGICGLGLAAKKALDEKGRENEGHVKEKRRLERGG